MPTVIGERSRRNDIFLLLVALFWVFRVRLGLTLSTFEKMRLRLLPETLDASGAAVDIQRLAWSCLLYTSDAADDLQPV